MMNPKNGIFKSKLTPREKDKLMISIATPSKVTKRLERGVKLNYPEAIALKQMFSKFYIIFRYGKFYQIKFINNVFF